MEKRRILFFLHKFPYPPADSTKFRVFHSVIEEFADFQRDFLIVTWEKTNSEARGRLERLGSISCRTLPRWRLVLNIVKRALSLRPWQVEMLYELSIEQQFRALIEDVDVVYVHTLRLGRYLEQLPEWLRRKIILDLNDSFARHYLRGWRAYPLALRLAILLEGFKFRRYERRMVRQFEHVTIVSEDDCARIMTEAPRQKRPVVTYASVPSRLPRVEQLASDGHVNLYFIGNYRYIPNRDGIEWFLTKIWPRLNAAIPSARLFLIGNAPPSLRKRYRKLPCIEWTGYLPDDELEALLDRMHIFISPVRIGAGIQGKIIEALFAGKPVIATEEAVFWVRNFPLLDELIFRARELSTWKSALEKVFARYDELCVALRSEPIRSLLEHSFSIQSVGAQYRMLADAIIDRAPSARHTTSTSNR